MTQQPKWKQSRYRITYSNSNSFCKLIHYFLFGNLESLRSFGNLFITLISEMFLVLCFKYQVKRLSAGTLYEWTHILYTYSSEIYAMLQCRFLQFLLVSKTSKNCRNFIDCARRPRVAVDWFFLFYIKVYAHNTIYHVYFQCVPI